MHHVRQLRQEFLDAGRSAETFERCARGYLGFGNIESQDGSLRPAEARALAERALAERALQKGTWLEYQSYDGRGRDQGKAVVIFDKWVSMADLSFNTWWPLMGTMSFGPPTRWISRSCATTCARPLGTDVGLRGECPRHKVEASQPADPGCH